MPYENQPVELERESSESAFNSTHDSQKEAGAPRSYMASSTPRRGGAAPAPLIRRLPRKGWCCWPPMRARHPGTAQTLACGYRNFSYRYFECRYSGKYVSLTGISHMSIIEFYKTCAENYSDLRQLSRFLFFRDSVKNSAKTCRL